jgi:hypothetical protein
MYEQLTFIRQSPSCRLSRQRAHKILIFYTTWMFITIFTKALSLSNAMPHVQFIIKCIMTLYPLCKSRDRAVGAATGNGARRQRGQSSSPGTVKNFHLPTSSRPIMGSIQPPIQWVPRIVPGGKAAETGSWPLTFNWCPGQENLDLYIHSPYTSSCSSA